MTANQKEFKALRGKIIEVYGSVREFAKAFGTTPQTIYSKLTGRTQWTLGEVLKASDLLGIADNTDEIRRIFFA